LFAKLQMLRDHGQAAKHLHSTLGWNARMDGIQAAILSVKLKRLEAANAARRVHARLYDKLLEDEPRVIRPYTAPHNLHAYHIYAVRVKDRDRVLQRMAAAGVNCAVHYPVPIHLQRAYSFLRLRPGAFPVAERCARELLSLPMYPELTDEQIEFVVQTLKESL
jgi:dTDP-4-amino-4,6-dideoxygalactose transaminase